MYSANIICQEHYAASQQDADLEGFYYETLIFLRGQPTSPPEKQR